MKALLNELRGKKLRAPFHMAINSDIDVYLGLRENKNWCNFNGIVTFLFFFLLWFFFLLFEKVLNDLKIEAAIGLEPQTNSHELSYQTTRPARDELPEIRF